MWQAIPSRAAASESMRASCPPPRIPTVEPGGRGEDIRFKVGESSLFLLNTRENKVLESMQKLAELKTKFFKSYRAVGWASGQLR